MPRLQITKASDTVGTDEYEIRMPFRLPTTVPAAKSVRYRFRVLPGTSPGQNVRIVQLVVAFLQAAPPPTGYGGFFVATVPTPPPRRFSLFPPAPPR